ncbi:hypothetical protein M9458_055958, partial [Cirrhinus mrigala]
MNITHPQPLKNCVYLDAECNNEHIKRETFQARSNVTSVPGASQTSVETVPVTRSFSRTSVNC